MGKNTPIEGAPTLDELDEMISGAPTLEELDSHIPDTIKKSFEPQSPLKTFADRTTDLAMQGYYPQVEAGLRQIPRALGVGGIDDYVTERDKIIAEMKRGEEENPIAHGSGTVAGIAANVALPAAKFAKLPKLERAAAQILANVGQGVVQNVGDTEGVIDPLQLPERNQVLSESLDFANHPVKATLNSLPAVSPILNKLDSAESRAFSALEPLGRKDLGAETLDRYVTKAGRAEGEYLSEKALGDFVLKNGILKAGNKVRDTYFNVLDFKDMIGERIGEFYAANQNKLNNIQNKVRSTLGKSPSLSRLKDYTFTVFDLNNLNEPMAKMSKAMRGDVGNEKAINTALGYFDQLKKDYGQNITLPAAHEIKQKLQEKVFNETRKKSTIQAKAYDELLKYVNSRIFKSIDDLDQVLGGKELDELRELNKLYMQASEVEAITRSAAARKGTQGKLPAILNPATYATGAYVLGNSITNDPIKSALGAILVGGGTAINRGLEGRGAGIAAELANASVPRLTSAPNRIGIGVENSMRTETPTEKARRINLERKAAKGVP